MSANATAIAESQNYKELLLLLNDCQTEYMIIGGHAVKRYAESRIAKDLDIWVGRSTVNCKEVFEARFGAPSSMTGDQYVYQIGVPPVRVDIMTRISGCDFRDAWDRRVSGVMEGVSVHFISLQDLIDCKRASGRSSDLEDVLLLGGE